MITFAVAEPGCLPCPALRTLPARRHEGVLQPDTGGHCGAYSISPGKLSAFPGFLQGEVSAGRVVVETTAQVIGGQLNPACH